MVLRFRLFLLFVVAVLCPVGFSQAPVGGVKVISSVDPVFPAEAGSYVYGGSVKVAVQVDKKGTVSEARVFGPLVPCGNLSDPVAAAVRKAAEEAARKTVFEPVLKNKKPAETALMLSYNLRPLRVPPKPGDVVTINGGDINGRAISIPKPAYPAKAKPDRIGGEVKLSVLIAEDGSVLSISPVSGHPFLIESSIESACQAKFKQTLLNGQPVRVLGIITYKFTP